MLETINISKYKTLIFDFGGVIINVDFSLTEKAFALFGIENVGLDFFNDREIGGIFDLFERGLITPSVFRTEMKKRIPTTVSDNDFDKAWNALLLDMPSDNIRIIEQLKQTHTCILLSNSNQIHYDDFQKTLETKFGYKKFSDLFHKAYFSHEIALRKPYTEIYQKVTKDLNLDPSSTLFMDDLEENTKGAYNAVGWDTILWQNRHLNELQL